MLSTSPERERKRKEKELLKINVDSHYLVHTVNHSAGIVPS